MELVSLKDLLALLIVVLREARVLKQLVPLESPADQSQLNSAGNHLNARLVGKSLREIRRQSPAEGLEGGIERSIAQLLEIESQREMGAYIEGLSGVLEQPEFQQNRDDFIDVIRLIDARSVDQLMPPATLENSGVSVVIGEEHPIRGDAALLGRHDTLLGALRDLGFRRGVGPDTPAVRARCGARALLQQPARRTDARDLRITGHVC